MRASVYSHRSSKFRRLLVLSIVTLLFASAHLAPAQDAVCTLADHIRSANTKTAVGFCPAGTSHDIITIAADITLTEPLPPITGAITIEGGGHTISRDGKFRIFDVQGGNLTIKNLSLTEGSTTERVGAAGPGGGGAIKLRNRSALIVNNSHFAKNSSAGYGGAILVSGKSRLRVHNSSFSDNRADGDGGAIAFWYGTGDISRSSFVDNSTRLIQTGGAIFVGIGVELEVTNSTFSGNSAGRGSAIGSEVWTPGGIVASKTRLTHVTMIDNGGQAIDVHKADQNFNLYNSIIAGASPGHCAGPLNENIGNLIADGSCAPAVRGDPLLAEMSGAPAYFPLRDGSPALDAAEARFCPETDQLGAPRPQGGGCDIGAIESTTAIPAPTSVPTICTLRDQIIAANTDKAYEACPAGSGADAIHMIRDYILTQTLPKITSDITIHGNGFTISGDRRVQIFDVDGGRLSITDVTLANGKAGSGGAIRLRNSGRAAVSHVAFKGNSASQGGAIATTGEGVRLLVKHSSFIGNSAEDIGGAILTDGGLIDIGESAFLENSARENGGAIHAQRGRLSVSNSTFHGNQADLGGGIYVHGAEVTLTHLTLIENAARRIRGAGVYGAGGALYLRNSIIAGSGSGDDCAGSIAEKRGNFSQDGTCAKRAGGDPLLGDLVESPAHYPLSEASPAHGAGDPAFCLATDQIGNPRPHCDIGAIESARDPNYRPAPAAGLPTDCTLAAQIIAANTDAPAGSCPAGDGADTIILRQSATLREPLPPINGDLTINGDGHTIDGDNRFPIFNIEGGTVVFKNLTLQNGSNPKGYGGAITTRNYVDFTSDRVTFRNNQARWGGAIANRDLSILRIYDSGFYDNAATHRGGAIYGDGRCIRVDGNTFRRNKAPLTKFIGGEQTHLDGRLIPCGGREYNYFSDT